MEEYTGKVAATVITRTDSREEFLLAKRSDTGEWEFPGGKQHREENILKTAEREIKEELDIEIKVLEASPKDSYESGGYIIVPVLATHSYSNVNNEIKLTDHSEYEWINARDDKVPKDERNCLEAFDLV